MLYNMSRKERAVKTLIQEVTMEFSFLTQMLFVLSYKKQFLFSISSIEITKKEAGSETH